MPFDGNENDWQPRRYQPSRCPRDYTTLLVIAGVFLSLVADQFLPIFWSNVLLFVLLMSLYLGFVGNALYIVHLQRASKEKQRGS